MGQKFNEGDEEQTFNKMDVGHIINKGDGGWTFYDGNGGHPCNIDAMDDRHSIKGMAPEIK